MINSPSHQADVRSQQNMIEAQVVKNDFELLSLSDVAKLLQVSPITMYRLIARKAMSVYRVGRRMRFHKKDVQDYLEKNRYARKED